MAEADERESRSAAVPVRGRLYRSSSDRMVAGLCGGLGEHFGVDPVWFRIGFVVLALSGGSGILIYLILWVIVPRRPVAAGDEPPVAAASTVPAAAVVGAVLMVVGGIALMNMIAPGIGRYFWPVGLLLVGLVLLVGSLTRDR